MALVPSTLENGFKDLVDTKPSTRAAAASKIAQLYNDYAQLAQAGGIPGIYTGLEKPLFESTLLAVLSSVQTSPAPIISAYVTAVTAYWMSPPIVFGAGAVTAAPVAATLIPLLTTVFSSFNSRDAYAAGMSAALDAGTKSVVATVGPNAFNLA